ncbi:RraA family protein [Rhodobacteraceae bacterium]|nr:RraA family protein [Paracoccaceae bacterium]
MTDPRIDAYERCYTSIIHDVLRAMGEADFTLPPNIRPLDPSQVLCGPVWTVTGNTVTTDAHQTLLAWTGLLSRAKPDHIWVAQPNTKDIAQMGELSAETLHSKGVLGCVIDGALRDTEFLLRLGFRSWGTHFTPRDVVGVWLPDATEVSIKIGDVTIETGDWLHGDRDGMVRIPAHLVDTVLEKAQAAMIAENQVRSAILQGVDPQEAYLRHGKF